jgi:hypothetical protein
VESRDATGPRREPRHPVPDCPSPTTSRPGGPTVQTAQTKLTGGVRGLGASFPIRRRGPRAGRATRWSFTLPGAPQRPYSVRPLRKCSRQPAGPSRTHSQAELHSRPGIWGPGAMDILRSSLGPDGVAGGVPGPGERSRLPCRGTLHWMAPVRTARGLSRTGPRLSRDSPTRPQPGTTYSASRTRGAPGHR